MESGGSARALGYTSNQGNAVGARPGRPPGAGSVPTGHHTDDHDAEREHRGTRTEPTEPDRRDDDPGHRPAGGRREPGRHVDAPLDPRPVTSRRRRDEQRGRPDGAERPSQSQQEQPKSQPGAGARHGQPRQDERGEQDQPADPDDERAADPVGEDPDQWREREHPEDVPADDQPDHLEARAAVVHVDRRHHHDRDHDGVAEGHPDRRGEDQRRVPDDRPRPVVVTRIRVVGLVLLPDRASQQQRVGSEAGTHHGGGGDQRHDGEHERAVFSGSWSHPATTAPGPLRFGPRTDPIVVAHTTAPRSRPRRAGSARSVAGYPALQVRGDDAPRSTIPTRSSGKNRITPETRQSPPPTAPAR